MEVEGKKSIAKRLRESLEKTEVSLLRLQSRESELEANLSNAKNQLKKARNEVKNAQGEFKILLRHVEMVELLALTKKNCILLQGFHS